MPRKRWILLSVAGLGALAASAVFASPQLTAPGTIRITDREVKRSRVDVGVHGRSTGDVLVLSQLLFNRRVTPKALGHGEMICTFLGSGASLGGGSSNCTGTFFLPKGKIMVQGVIHSRLFYELAVVGGTGLYENVRGSLTVTSLGENPWRELLLFRLNV